MPATTMATSTEEAPLDSCSPPRETEHPQPRDGEIIIASEVPTESKREAKLRPAAEEEEESCDDDDERISRLVAPAAPAVAPPPPPVPPPPSPPVPPPPSPAPPPPPLQRARRVAGGADPAAACPSLARLLALIDGRDDDSAQRSQGVRGFGAVLRVKQYLRADAGPRELDAVIDALRGNSRVQALYLQNFERGMGDAQLRRLTEMLKVNRNIWALNVGENFEISLGAWRDFAAALEETSVAFLYVSEHHLLRSQPPLKPRMRAALRRNRDRLLLEGRVPPAALARLVKNMWWNPTSWLERLGVGTRTPRGGDAKEALSPPPPPPPPTGQQQQQRQQQHGNGGGGGTSAKSRSKGGKRAAALRLPSLVRKADKGSYEPSRRPTSRSGAASRAAEGRREEWEALRKGAREELTRRSAQAAERLRREAEAGAAVRVLVARALARAVARAVEAAEAAAGAAADRHPRRSPEEEGDLASTLKRKKSEKEAAREEDKKRQKRQKKEKKEKTGGAARASTAAAATTTTGTGEEVERASATAAPPPPCPFAPPTPWLRKSRKGLLLPSSSSSSSDRHVKPSMLLPRLGKTVPSGAAVPRGRRTRRRGGPPPAAALLSEGAAATPAATASGATPAAETVTEEEAARQPAALPPPPAPGQQLHRQQQKLPFDLEDPLFESLAEWEM